MSAVRKTTYTPAFKGEAVRLYLEGGRSYRQICEELGIKDKKSLHTWVAKVKRGDSRHNAIFERRYLLTRPAICRT